MNTFNSFCIGACIFMIFLGFSFGFIDAMGSFPTSQTSPFGTDSSLDIVENLSSNITGSSGKMSWGQMWGIGTGALTIGVIGIAILTGTTNMIGVYLFGTFFWSSWASLVGILYTFSFLSSGAGLILLTMITVGMSIMFVGAIIGMLSGSVSMR
jgi:hypothetical protein